MVERQWSQRSAVLICGTVLLSLAVGLWLYHGPSTVPTPGTVIDGGDAGGWPRADASAEGFDMVALQAAAARASLQKIDALLVVRHSHLVFERYSDAINASTLVDGGELSRLVLALAGEIAAARYQTGVHKSAERAASPASIAALSGMSYAEFLRRYLWRPLNAAPAQLVAPDSLRARAGDWLRVAEVLANEGRFEGSEFITPMAVQRIVRPATALGLEPFAVSPLYCWRGPGATRLYFAPRYALVILTIGPNAPDTSSEEARLPNMVIRALRDRGAATQRRSEAHPQE